MRTYGRAAGHVIATAWPALGLAALLPAAAAVSARFLLGDGGCAAATAVGVCPMDPLRGDYRDAALLVFSAATGAPVAWEPTPAPGPAETEFALLSQLPYMPWLAVTVLLPSLPGLLLAYSVSRRARRTGVRRYRVLIPALAGYGLGLVGITTLLLVLPGNGGLVVHSLPVPLVALLGTVWAGTAATAALALADLVSRHSAARD